MIVFAQVMFEVPDDVEADQLAAKLDRLRLLVANQFQVDADVPAFRIEGSQSWRGRVEFHVDPETGHVSQRSAAELARMNTVFEVLTIRCPKCKNVSGMHADEAKKGTVTCSRCGHTAKVKDA